MLAPGYIETSIDKLNGTGKAQSKQITNGLIKFSSQSYHLYHGNHRILTLSSACMLQ